MQRPGRCQLCLVLSALLFGVAIGFFISEYRATSATHWTSVSLPPRHKLMVGVDNSASDAQSAPDPVPSTARIHVGFIWSKSSRHQLALRSLLMHRTCPISFHFLVNEEGRADLERFFNKSTISRTCDASGTPVSEPNASGSGDASTADSISFYDLAAAAHFLDIPGLPGTRHKAGQLTRLKLWSHAIFSAVPKFLLVIDRDVLVVGDVCAPLVRVQQAMRQPGPLGQLPFFAMAPEMSPMFSHWQARPHARITSFANTSCRFDDPPVPNKALTLYGANGGVVLYNVAEMRRANFTALMVPILLEYKEAISGDQTPLNMFLEQYPQFFYPLAATWNLQLYDLNDWAVAFQCVVRPAPQSLLIVHGNSGSLATLPLYVLEPYDKAPHSAPVICGCTSNARVATLIADALVDTLRKRAHELR